MIDPQGAKAVAKSSGSSIATAAKTGDVQKTAGAVGNAVNTGINAAVGLAAAMGVRVPAMLRCTSIPNIGFVPFDFNPEKIVIKRSAEHRYEVDTTGTMSPAGSSGTIVKKARPPTITLSDLIFEGLTTKFRCDQLMRWISPYSGMSLIPGLPSTGANYETTLPKLTFQWGPPVVAFMYDVVITSCTVTYNRFNAAGIPIKAKVDLTLKQEPSMFASYPTNPTSGGLPGRRTHLVSEGDTVQSIATANYGRPGVWRLIAEVNKINDPARLRVGSTIYLPNHDELLAGSDR